MRNYDQRWAKSHLQSTSYLELPKNPVGWVEERQIMDVVVEAQGSPFVFRIVVFGMTTYERLVHALPQYFFVANDERLTILPSQANKRWTYTPSPRRPCSRSPSSSYVLSFIVRFLE